MQNRVENLIGFVGLISGPSDVVFTSAADIVKELQHENSVYKSA
jgi:hypothetical protein